ncbi:MAG: glycosyltransferase [Flavobacteriales bacterium]|nr:glycosyltransferase [Flavobacteriales bacterium]MCB9499668.1 glycosyltransferase [Erysipelotrichaceae bacterium]
MNPKVSIITVCYNSSKTIEDTIQSVVNQTYDNIEYIVIDGVSTDNTLEIINKYKSQITTIICEKDNGIYDAINKGIDLATGDIIANLNSDDFYIDNNVIADVVATFEKEKTDTLYGDLYYVDAVDTNKIVRYWKSKKYKEGLFLKGWMPPHPTFFVKKEVYQKFGLFDLQFKSAADYEIMLRFIHRFKASIAYLPRVVVKMRVGGVSNASLSNRIKANKEDRRAWEVNGLKPTAFTLILKPLSKILQFVKK